MKTKSKANLVRKLTILKNESSNSLKDYCIDYILDDFKNDDDIKMYIDNLSSHGCISGMINSLIYYSDTNKFYDKYYDEIEEIIHDLEQSIGETISPKSGDDRKNFYAWLGFEEMTRQIANDIGLEI